ncbi:MAG TPA: PilT/PilU family type 4a pilus ATPase [Phycisphaerae bacterium]|nr:PilT/PilU family type 4a pilus ATPase [Phycisphaerae bacterium]
MADIQPIDEHDQHGERHGKAPRLHKYFQAISKQKASDLHLKSGAVAHIRLQTVVRPVKGEPLSGDEIAEMVDEILTDKQKAFFEEFGSIDVAEELEGGDRFRINIFRQRGDVSIAVRRVSREIMDFDELNLPPDVRKIANLHAGLVLVSGITGSGKSTTIAAMIEHINKTRPCHVVTVEDPIEYIYTDKKALISQREVGIDVPTFESALKYLMREDPDVVLIGEMRDRETFQAALQAAETGHLVFGTIHASGASSTVARILDLFPPESRDLARQALAFNLRAVISQRLLPCLVEEIGRVPAVEILMINPSARQLIHEGRDAELIDVIRTSEHEGMQDFTKSLMELIDKDLIDPKIACEVAPNPDELKMRMKGISSSRAGLVGR